MSKNKRLDVAVDDVVKAWAVKGPNPAFHDKAKAELRRNWPTLYNAVKSLVLTHAYIGNVPEQIARGRCTECKHEWVVVEGEEIICPNCESGAFVEVRMIRRPIKK